MKSPEHFLPSALIPVLKRQHYALFGHSAVKLCHYTKSSLTKNKTCYKQRFYGIQSHRCIQMTPAVSFCDQNCRFCWRPLFRIEPIIVEPSNPKEIVQESIEKQRLLLSGYGALMEQIGERKLNEAMNPRHVAISLSGEPTLYPLLSELIEAYHSNGFSTFLVSNGQHPEVLEKLSLPTQLYISLEAFNEKLHRQINAPLRKGSWEKLNQTLELLPSLNTRKAIRLTLMKGINMFHEKEFAKLIEKASPDFVELKAYMFVGYSRQRMKEENMPLHSEVKDFAVKLNKHLNYKLVDEQPESRVVLLWNEKTSLKIFGD
jgi:tRNA wybutosine-synthesizing protein 1